jgi:putative DNA primase/helicase
VLEQRFRELCARPGDTRAVKRFEVTECLDEGVRLASLKNHQQILDELGKTEHDHLTFEEMAGGNVQEVTAADITGGGVVDRGDAEGDSEVITHAGRYFDRAGLRARTLLSDCERLGPLASGIDGKVWAYIDGVWVHGDRILRSRVVDLLGERYRRAHADTVESMVQAREPFINDTPVTDYLNVENGLLQWRTGRLKPHTDKVPSTTRIPVRWNPDAKCPNIDKFLRSVVDAECVPILEEVAGYALYPDQPLHKAVMLDGSGRNGKGVYLRILSALIGPANIAATPPQRLDTDRWAVAQLYGKLANLVGDVDPRTFKETATFKQATGQDMLQGEHKYAAPFTFTSRALIVAPFNSLPRSVDTTEGFFSRWLVVPFPNQFVDPDENGNVPAGCRAKDPELAAKVTSTAELEGFLVRAVAGLQRVMKLGRFTRAEAITDAETEFRRHADPVRGFLADRTIGDRDAWISRADLHAAFKSWSADAGLGALSAKRFTEKVREVHVETFGYPHAETIRAGSRGWAGIRPRTFADEPDDEVHKVHKVHQPLLSPPYAREKGKACAPSAPSAPDRDPDTYVLCTVCGQQMCAPVSIERGHCERCELTVKRDNQSPPTEKGNTA